jgi:hypothetical protein
MLAEGKLITIVMPNNSITIRLCCLPIQVKAKYYPLILIVLFTVFFGLQLSLFVGLIVGYVYFYGYLKFIDISVIKAKSWEGKFPFKAYSAHGCKIDLIS